MSVHPESRSRPRRLANSTLGSHLSTGSHLLSRFGNFHPNVEPSVSQENSRERLHTETSGFDVNSPTSSSSHPHLTSLPQVFDAFTEGGHQEQPEEALDPRRVPHVQNEGRKVWKEFDNRTKSLEKDLQKFQHAVQELGSSLDLARSARDIRRRLIFTMWVIQENASKIFPLAVPRGRPPRVDTAHVSEQRHLPHWPPSSASLPHQTEMRPLFIELRGLADGFESLREAMEHFPEFDSSGDWHLKYFQGDLRYWSSCLERYTDQFDSREVHTYVHDLSSDLGRQFDEIDHHIRQYIACVPTVRLAQRHAMSNLQNLATIATFFSAVTATTIQYSYQNNDNNVSKAVNALWFSSLVFSIASALNSSLALMWRRAVYSSPRLRVPWWLWVWIRQCPSIFLLISVVTFLAGLGCFTIASTQSHITRVLVITCEGISSLGLAGLLLWLATEKWSFYLLQRQQPSSRFGSMPFLGKPKNSKSALPTHIERTASWSIGHFSRATRAFFAVTSCLNLRPHSPDIVVKSVSPPLDHAPQPRTDIPSHPSTALSPELRRWHKIKTVIPILGARKADQAEGDWDIRAHDESVRTESMENESTRHKDNESESMNSLQSRLHTISMTGEALQHEAGEATSGIQFDPQGDSLAICGKRLSLRWQLRTSKSHNLPHSIATGQACQVIWTTCGDHMLTRAHRAVHVWTMSGDIKHKILSRPEISNFILSVPNLEPDTLPMFVSIEGISMNKLVLLDICGKEHMTHEFEDASIRTADVIMLAQCSYVLLAAEILQSAEGWKPMNTSPVRKLMVFNLKNQQVEHEVPLWHTVKHVTMSSHSQLAIVTYKAYPPPQLWRIIRTRNSIRLSLERQFCARERASTHEFEPSRQIQFSGKGHFLHHDRFVLCTTTEGKIHIWRRDKAEPVHVIGGWTSENDKPVQVACNRSSEDFMFATLSKVGVVRVWKAQSPLRVLRVDPDGQPSSVVEQLEGNHTPLDALTESPQMDADLGLPVLEEVGEETEEARQIATDSELG